MKWITHHFKKKNRLLGNVKTNFIRQNLLKTHKGGQKSYNGIMRTKEHHIL